MRKWNIWILPQNEPDWDALPDGEKQFYLSCINRLLLEKELLDAALATYEVCV